MSIRDTLLASFLPHGQALHLMMVHTGSKLQGARQAVERVRFDAAESERLINETAASLQTLVKTAARIEMMTLRPAGPEVCSFVEETQGALQEMAIQVGCYKALTRAGDARKRNARLES